MLRIKIDGADIEVASAPLARAMDELQRARAKLAVRSAGRDLLAVAYAGLLAEGGMPYAADVVDAIRGTAEERPDRFEHLQSQAEAIKAWLGIEEGPIWEALDAIAGAEMLAKITREREAEQARLRSSAWWAVARRWAGATWPKRGRPHRVAMALWIMERAQAIGGTDHTRWVLKVASGRPVVILADGTAHAVKVDDMLGVQQ